MFAIEHMVDIPSEGPARREKKKEKKSQFVMLNSNSFLEYTWIGVILYVCCVVI